MIISMLPLSKNGWNKINPLQFRISKWIGQEDRGSLNLNHFSDFTCYGVSDHQQNISHYRWVVDLRLKWSLQYGKIFPVMRLQRRICMHSVYSVPTSFQERKTHSHHSHPVASPGNGSLSWEVSAHFSTLKMCSEVTWIPQLFDVACFRYVRSQGPVSIWKWDGLSRYGDFHYQDKMAYLYTGNSHTSNMTSLYWGRPQGTYSHCIAIVCAEYFGFNSWRFSTGHNMSCLLNC